MRVNSLRETALASLVEMVAPVVVDVGARGGLDTDFAPAAWASTIVGFEPETEEAARLQAAPHPDWRRVLILPHALGGLGDRAANLHLPSDHAAASLLPHNPKMIDQFGRPHLHRTLRTIPLETVTLSEALDRSDIARVSYLKLDVEGAELAILQGCEDVLARCSAIKVEVAFQEQRLAQPLGHTVMGYLAERGFTLADVRDIHRWRSTQLPGHPLRTRHPMAYSRGLVVQCDLVFLKDLEHVGPADAAAFIATAAILGYLDVAEAAGEKFPDVGVSTGIDLTAALREVSRLYGREVSREELRTALRQAPSLLKSAFNRLSHGAPRH